MNSYRVNQTASHSIEPTCACCLPTQRLVTTGQRAFCPLTERIYDNAANATNVANTAREPEVIVDFYPTRRQKGEAAPFAINPAEDRFGR